MITGTPSISLRWGWIESCDIGCLLSQDPSSLGKAAFPPASSSRSRRSLLLPCSCSSAESSAELIWGRCLGREQFSKVLQPNYHFMLSISSKQIIEMALVRARPDGQCQELVHCRYTRKEGGTGDFPDPAWVSHIHGEPEGRTRKVVRSSQLLSLGMCDGGGAHLHLIPRLF